MIKRLLLLGTTAILLFSQCNEKPSPDLIIVNGNVWTVDSKQPKAEALAVLNGKIIKVGTTTEILELKGQKTQEIDAKGAFVMPGWIEGHGHFSKEEAGTKKNGIRFPMSIITVIQTMKN